MKGKFSLLALLFALAVSCCLYSCSEKQDWRPALSDDGSAFPLDEIKRSFARDYAAAPMTRVDLKMDSTDIMNPGYIRPRWDSVLVYQGENLFQASTAFEAEYDYYVLRLNETDSLLYPMPKRVVVLKEPDSGKTASYLRFLIPDTGNTVPDDGADFTGFVLYTTLSGEPVTLGQYDAGELSDSLSVFDSTEPNAESVDRMLGRMEGLYVARVREGVATRAVNIPVVVIDGWAPLMVLVDRMTIFNGLKPDFPDFPAPPLGDIDFGIGGGGGSSGGGEGNSGKDGPRIADKTFPYNPKIKYDDNKVRLILDSLNRDCMGQLLINAIKKNVSITSGYLGSSRVEATIVNFPSGSVVTGYEIRMGSRLDPISMMEELMHIYQGLGTPAFRQAAMNYEVEAKLAWYMYCERYNIKQNFAPMLGGKKGEINFIIMQECLLMNDLENPVFIEAFDDAVRILRNNSTYKNEERYPYDPCKMDCEKLMELMRDCIK